MARVRGAPPKPQPLGRVVPNVIAAATKITKP
jgi:hypothetical protein